MRGIRKRGSALEESVAAPEIKARGQAVMKNSLAGSWESPETQPTPLGTPHPRVVASVHRALQVGERHMEVCHPCCCGDSSPQRSGCQTQGLSAHGAPLFSSTRAPPPEGMDMAPLQSLSLQPHRPGHTPAHSDWGCHPLASRMANALIPERAHLSGQVHTRPCCDVPILSTSVARLPHPQFWGACHPETFMLGEQSR